MEFKTTIIDDYSVVALSGEIDLYCSADARREILNQLTESKSVLVDLSEVSYIDSSAVASLVEGYQMAGKNNLKFGLVSVSNEVMQVLKLARLDKIFIIHNSIELATKG